MQFAIFIEGNGKASKLQENISVLSSLAIIIFVGQKSKKSFIDSLFPPLLKALSSYFEPVKGFPKTRECQ